MGISHLFSRIHGVAAKRWPWVALLVLVALCYYGSYYRHGLNFRDEGGTVGLLAKRILDGERPFLDLVLGYNVLWFYPVAGLFKIFGVNFVVLRAYCFGLSILAAVFGFLSMERATRRPWLAFLASLILVLVPGMTFKNYIPLLATANLWALLAFIWPRAAEPPRTALPWGRLAIGGLILGLSFLVRIDVATFVSVLWLGALLLIAIAGQSFHPLQRGLAVTLGPLLLAIIVCAVHLPVWWDAQRRGFDREFLAQYQAWPRHLGAELSRQLGFTHPPAPSHVPAKITNTPPPGDTADKETLQRKGLRDIVQAKDENARLLAALLYAPLLTIVPLVLWSLLRLWQSLRGTDRNAFRAPLAALLVIGAALTTFPQYFFFRPDAPHLSEFSPGFWTAAVGAIALLISRDARGRWMAAFLAVLLAAHAGFYLYRMLPDRWTGTVAVKKSRTRNFDAENGVNVLVSKREQQGLLEMQKLIKAHSKPDDYLVAYPYHPAINLLADRRTYEKNVYVDNATRTADWDAEAIQRIERYKPAVIVLSDWNVNGTEASRFSVWATTAKTWIQTNYTYQGTYLEFEVYTRVPSP